MSYETLGFYVLQNEVKKVTDKFSTLLYGPFSWNMNPISILFLFKKGQLSLLKL